MAGSLAKRPRRTADDNSAAPRARICPPGRVDGNDLDAPFRGLGLRSGRVPFHFISRLPELDETMSLPEMNEIHEMNEMKPILFRGAAGPAAGSANSESSVHEWQRR